MQDPGGIAGCSPPHLALRPIVVSQVQRPEWRDGADWRKKCSQSHWRGRPAGGPFVEPGSLLQPNPIAPISPHVAPEGRGLAALAAGANRPGRPTTAGRSRRRAAGGSGGGVEPAGAAGGVPGDRAGAGTAVPRCGMVSSCLSRTAPSTPQAPAQQPHSLRQLRHYSEGLHTG